MERYQKKNKTKFEVWRKNQIDLYNTICKLSVGRFFQKNISKENLSLVPKCLVQITKRYCNCDTDCVRNSILGTDFNLECLEYDLHNLYLHDRFIDCRFLNENLPENEKIYNFLDEMSINTKKNIFKGIDYLCNGDIEYYPQLQCGIYELRDGCNEISECYDFMLNGRLSAICEVDTFETIVSEVLHIINYPELENRIQDSLEKSKPSHSNLYKRSITNYSDNNFTKFDSIKSIAGKLMPQNILAIFSIFLMISFFRTKNLFVYALFCILIIFLSF